MKLKNANYFMITSIVLAGIAFIILCALNFGPQESIFHIYGNIDILKLSTPVVDVPELLSVLFHLIVVVIAGIITISNQNPKPGLFACFIGLIMTFVLNYFFFRFVYMGYIKSASLKYGPEYLAAISIIDSVSSFIVSPLITISIIFMAVSTGILFASSKTYNSNGYF